MDQAFIDRLRNRVQREANRLLAKQWTWPDAMRSARVKAAFKTFDDVYWKLEPIEDEDPYDDSYIDDPKEKKEIQKRVENEGVWGVKASWRLSEDDVTDHGRLIMSSEWEEADATWGFIGDDWKDSGYDTDLMRSAMNGFLEAANQIPLAQVPEDVVKDFWNAVEAARFATRSDKEVTDADAQGFILLGGQRWPIRREGEPEPESAAAIVPTTQLPYLFAKYTFQIRQDMYAGWNVFMYEQRPESPWRAEKMTSAIEPKSEALKVAASYAHDLAQRIPPNPNAIRVLDEYGLCTYAVKSTVQGPIEVACRSGEIDFDRPSPPKHYFNPRANPISNDAKAAIVLGIGAIGLGIFAWWLSRTVTWSAVLGSPPEATPGGTYRWSWSGPSPVAALQVAAALTQGGWTNVSVWMPGSALPPDWPSNDTDPTRVRIQGTLPSNANVVDADLPGSLLWQRA